VTSMDELNAAYSAAGASLYQQAQAQGSPGGDQGGPQAGPTAEPPGKEKEDVVEADYEIVDEGKK